MTFESYTIILRHEFEYNDGNRFEIEPPLVLKHCYDRAYGCSGIVLNRMFDEMKHEALKRITDGGDK